jgi:hypothetical protein
MFFGVPHFPTCIFLSFHVISKPGLGIGIDPGMALKTNISNLVLDEIRTHDLSILSRVRYPVD